MHLTDGLISPVITLPAYAVAAPLWYFAARKHADTTALDALPEVGVLTGAAFVLQSLMIPLPGSTSTHLVGVTIIALLRGPLMAFLCESIVLLLQATVTGQGGLTVLALNALAMGLVGPGLGWLTAKFVSRFAPRIAGFLAGWVSVTAASTAIALVLALQHRLDPLYFPIAPSVSFAVLLLPSIALTGLLEGGFTAMAERLLRRRTLSHAS